MPAQRLKVVNAQGMDPDTFYLHVEHRHPGMLQLSKSVPALREMHEDEHLMDKRRRKGFDYTHYHEEVPRARRRTQA